MCDVGEKSGGNTFMMEVLPTPGSPDRMTHGEEGRSRSRRKWYRSTWEEQRAGCRGGRSGARGGAGGRATERGVK